MVSHLLPVVSYKALTKSDPGLRKVFLYGPMRTGAFMMLAAFCRPVATLDPAESRMRPNPALVTLRHGLSHGSQSSVGPSLPSLHHILRRILVLLI